ncbi:Major facilitator superfamily domain general substrate transporter [Macrophomina phaseolina MS6]|uniref:Major facilitator superfamily domain general substrate transporter n=1 Tax=Macrophomina phaseolina (strain MS6) TaxID=1126212 RepID=K2RHF5_MACPH|nr:Major facilitator superfamily domain general substrate transporter [Macrophomina phaseolina MS6]
MSVGLAGYLIATASPALVARYLTFFLMLAGVNGPYNIALAWIFTTMPRPIEKRSAVIAIINSAGNVAQIYSPALYLAKDGPRYIKAMATYSSFCLACICATLFLRLCLQRGNRKIAQQEGTGAERADDKERAVGRTYDEGFRYVL